MNLYVISQTIKNSYGTYDSVVVAAENEDQARDIHPCGYSREWDSDFWVAENQKEYISVEHIGIADNSIKEPCVILASFNAG